jgi:alkylated DNA repair dioxygenase AlkB
MRDPDQPSLFESMADVQLPEGFRYQRDVISVEEEEQLLREVAPLPFKDFEFHGFLGKRRVVSFGWRYDFGERELQKSDDIPPFLLPLRERAAAFAGMSPDDLQHVLVTEYGPGAAIGWHKDKGVFGQVIGISLLTPCRFRLRREQDGKWKRVNITAEPRSAYLLSGPARSDWEHSIPAVEQLRYSITFRNLKAHVDATPPTRREPGTP